MQEHDKTNDEDHSQGDAQEQSAFAHNAEQPQQTGQETGGQIAGETPPSTSAQQPASQAGPNTTKQFWQGIAWGAIPLVVFLISYVAALQPNESGLGFALLAFFGSVVGYLVLLIVAIIFLFNKRVRFVGYGLLTMVLISPIIAAIGCQIRF